MKDNESLAWLAAGVTSALILWSLLALIVWLVTA